MRAAAMLILLVSGCDPIMNMGGSVHARGDRCAAGGEIYARGEPLAGAEVAVRCPGIDDPMMSATTDASGRFAEGSAGLMGAQCEVVVTKDGYRPARFNVGDLCAVRSTGMIEGCHTVSIQAELAPE